MSIILQAKTSLLGVARIANQDRQEMANPWASPEKKGEDALLQEMGRVGSGCVKKKSIGTNWGFEDGAFSLAGL